MVARLGLQSGSKISVWIYLLAEEMEDEACIVVERGRESFAVVMAATSREGDGNLGFKAALA
ncbi:hypothetical protein LR48_Vigan05g091500 [Vigna angularis]|uniref:Uncharacterized protein n=1 Tax=Phaseolus angularis TaxID=3914 RepID=A0A0L9UKU1_PHAAN|nr:hypothetical protein LR48_Vigan05g091500 [Vigna angularis]